VKQSSKVTIMGSRYSMGPDYRCSASNMLPQAQAGANFQPLQWVRALWNGSMFTGRVFRTLADDAGDALYEVELPDVIGKGGAHLRVCAPQTNSNRYPRRLTPEGSREGLPNSMSIRAGLLGRHRASSAAPLPDSMAGECHQRFECRRAIHAMRLLQSIPHPPHIASRSQ
jgi:hypothetical protein